MPGKTELTNGTRDKFDNANVFEEFPFLKVIGTNTNPADGKGQKSLCLSDNKDWGYIANKYGLPKPDKLQTDESESVLLYEKDGVKCIINVATNELVLDPASEGVMKNWWVQKSLKKSPHLIGTYMTILNNAEEDPTKLFQDTLLVDKIKEQYDKLNNKGYVIKIEDIDFETDNFHNLYAMVNFVATPKHKKLKHTLKDIARISLDWSLNPLSYRIKE